MGTSLAEYCYCNDVAIGVCDVHFDVVDRDEGCFENHAACFVFDVVGHLW